MQLLINISAYHQFHHEVQGTALTLLARHELNGGVVSVGRGER